MEEYFSNDHADILMKVLSFSGSPATLLTMFFSRHENVMSAQSIQRRPAAKATKSSFSNIYLYGVVAISSQLFQLVQRWPTNKELRE